jgi:hypothetical protein
MVKRQFEEENADATKKLRNLGGQQYTYTDKELDLDKITPFMQAQLARRGRAETAGGRGQGIGKGIGSGMRKDVGQVLGAAAATVAQTPSVVTANPQKMKGMRMDPRSLGGTSAGPVVQTLGPKQTGSQRIGPPVQSGGGGVGRAGADNRQWGPQGHVYGGGMTGYSQQGHDDSDISAAERAQANATEAQKRAGTRIVTGGLVPTGMKTAAFGGILGALGIPAKMIMGLLPGMFMKSVFSPLSMAKMGFGMYKEHVNTKAYEKAFGPNTPGDKLEADRLEKGLDMDEKEREQYYNQLKDAEEVGYQNLVETDQIEYNVDPVTGLPTTPKLPDTTDPTTEDDAMQDSPDATLDSSDPSTEDDAGQDSLTSPDTSYTPTPNLTNKPIDQWSYNPDMSIDRGDSDGSPSGSGGGSIGGVSGDRSGDLGSGAGGGMTWHKGGVVKGRGEVDTKLLAGEYVLRREAVKEIGVDTLNKLNKKPAGMRIRKKNSKK